MFKKNGNFVISLDFELMWGVRDVRTIENYGENILGVRKSLNEIFKKFEEYNVSATIATVGFLLCKNRRQLLDNMPQLKPAYHNVYLSPYPDIENYIGRDEQDDPHHFAWSLVQQIKDRQNLELSTHTFCHYYCLESGQSIDEFAADINSALLVAKNNGITIKSIVFPRNQVNSNYIEICKELCLKSYRGNPKSWTFKFSSNKFISALKRIIRLLDTYLNLTGHNCYYFNRLNEKGIYNIPASRFLKPYSKQLRIFEYLKIKRIKNDMTYAAKNKLLYHLWWHPHNFGINIDKNIRMLTIILDHYRYLNNIYSFNSITMTELSEELESRDL